MRTKIALALAALLTTGIALPSSAEHDVPKAVSVTSYKALADGFTIDWKPVKRATAYHVQFAKQADMDPRRHVTTTKSISSVHHLAAGQRYYVRVVAFNQRKVILRSQIKRITVPAKAKPPIATPAPAPTSAPPSTPPTAPAGMSAPLASKLHTGAVELGSGMYTFNDFNQMGSTAGYEIPATVSSISGSGSGSTVLQMTPHSSTRAGAVPTASYTTNQLSLLVSHGTALSNLTLQGTEQGHLYNGLRVHRANHTHVTNVKVAAMPGNKNYPPGETFGINDYRTVGSVYQNLEIDGAGVGAAGFGGNNSQDISITDAYFHNNPYSAGITFWQSSNITLTNVRSFNNHGGFNFERDSGTIRIVKPAWGSLGNRHSFSFNSDQASANVSIIDPVLPAGETKVKILVAPSYLGVPNKQQESDIHIYQNGKDVTATLALFAH